MKLTEKIFRADARYVKNYSYLIVNKFIILLPLTKLHESPEQLPVYYSSSGDNFKSEIPQNIYEYFHKRAKVSNVEIRNGSGLILMNEELRKGTNINVCFEGDNYSNGMGFQFMQSSISNWNESTNTATMINEIPKEISDESFIEDYFSSVRI